MMKKRFIIMLSALFALTATGCQKQPQNKKQEVKQEMKAKMGTITLTKETFKKNVWDYEANPKEWKYAGNKPAIVDFFATWCGPCKMVSPILEELSKEYDGKIVVYKVDVDQEEELAATFGIQSIPTILFIPMKGKPQMVNGAMPKQALKDTIESVLLK